MSLALRALIVLLAATWAPLGCVSGGMGFDPATGRVDVKAGGGRVVEQEVEIEVGPDLEIEVVRFWQCQGPLTGGTLETISRTSGFAALAWVAPVVAAVTAVANYLRSLGEKPVQQDPACLGPS